MPANPLPRGQRVDEWTRFGLPWFAGVRPAVPDRPVLWVAGTVRRPVQIGLDELLAELPRREQVSDLHCVTTWSATGLRWSGFEFRDVQERLAAAVRPHPDCRWLAVTGMDGYRICLRLDDLLAGDVLLADQVDGAVLPDERGGPIRLVTPAHYGYTSVRQVCRIDYLRRYESGSARWLAHPRGRVAREERGRFLPGPVWRVLWRRLLPRIRRPYAG